MSWWNPFAWAPDGSGGERDGRDERDDGGIWGGLGSPGSLHAGLVLGEGSVALGPNADLGALETVPSEVAVAYGGVGAGFAGGLRALGVGRLDLGEPAWRAFTRLAPGPPETGGVDVGTGLGDARDTSEEDWAWMLAGDGERS